MANVTTLYLTCVVVALLNFGGGHAYCCYTRVYESYIAKPEKTSNDVVMVKILRSIRIFLLISCLILSGFFAYLGINGLT